MSNSGVKIEVHLIQNFAPSNLNRDDTGQPKSAYFGGFRRARVSSQCGKRAAREWWRERGTVAVGERTKRLQQLIEEKLSEDDAFMKVAANEEERKTAIGDFVSTYYAAPDKKKPESTSVLIFISPEEIEVCAAAIMEMWPKIEKRKDVDARIKASRISADIALFGRMLAEQPGRNTDGACQVAHPISTHKVDMEMDFYTAVDDLNPEEETGAGMMGIIGFNSACYYRYALVDRDQLARNLTGKTERKDGEWAQRLEAEDYREADGVIGAFLEAIVYAIPSGKQNSFAAQNLPSFGLFVRREGGVPVSLANAFAKPVRPRKDDDDLIGLSVDALTKHWETIAEVYGAQGIKKTACFHVGQSDRLNGLKESDKGSVEAAIKAVIEAEK